MTLSNVKLILGREIRDQLRDRRTLFMIAVLPLLLYPLIGMTFVQVAQFLKENTSQVCLVGKEELPLSPALLDEDGQIDSSLFSSTARAKLIALTAVQEDTFEHGDPALVAREFLDRGEFDAVIYFPPQFGENLKRFREEVGASRTTSDATASSGLVDVPRPAIFFNTAKDKSRVAHDRVLAVLTRWRERIVDQTLVENRLSVHATSPFEVIDSDVSEPAGRQAAVWSKVLPFVMLIWALTGAFYPAIDLCAGEKERGTLETLLSSPAERSEIVLGKLVTIMLFSMLTALLNLLSMIFTATFVIDALHGAGPAGSNFQLGPPPWFAVGWLLLALVPLSALFSALSLALATMARSTKEGQYYLMPLLLITMPLLVLPMLPAAELDLGTSLIPISGVMLLLRTLMEGEHTQALVYSFPVISVTIGGCLLAVRWAIDQFNNEFVLFRESERLDLGLWLLHLVRDRQDTPSAGEAIMCGVLLLMVRFFASFLLPFPDTWNRFAVLTAVSLIAFIAAPVLLMAVILTRRPRMALLLQRPVRFSVPAALLLAVSVHPLAIALTEVVHYLYPVSDETRALFSHLLAQAPNRWQVLLVLALIPAICEELAFRGFILSGLRHMGHKWTAIVISSVFFGLSHGFLQQSLVACAAGALLGYIAVQTRSLLPCMVFHVVHNSLALMYSQIAAAVWEKYPIGQWIFDKSGDSYTYQWPAIVASAALTWIVLAWFRALPFQPTEEEQLQRALDHQSAHAPA